jgi:hypothetical protein
MPIVVKDPFKLRPVLAGNLKGITQIPLFITATA